MASNEENSLLVVGTGAMACMFAVRLSAANVPFTMLGNWAEGVNALNENGVQLIEPGGKITAFPVRAVRQPEEVMAATGQPGVRYALVLVKSWQTHLSARQLARCLSPDGLALTLQNGLGNREILAKELGAKRVALGVTTIGANLVGPAQVRPAGEGVTSLSEHPRLTPLADLLRAAGFFVEYAHDARVLLWGKLVINAAINPLTAILGVPNGELVVRPSARSLLAAAAREAAAVAVAQGVALPYPDPVVAAESIAQRTATNISSMLQDVRRGAPTEIDAINGAIVHAGQQTGTPTPINRTLWQLVNALVGRGGTLRKI